MGVVACSHTRFVNRWTSDSASGGGGSSSCQVFYRAWDDDPPPRFPLRNRTCLRHRPYTEAPGSRRVTPSVWNR